MSVDSALERLTKAEPALRAWVRVDADGARAAALRAPNGPLHGMPFGVKDIIDVVGLPTECGSPLRRGRVAEADAWLVERLRGAGAVPVGKTVTTEFAYFQPGPTRNPCNLEHTPGGSSSGSAAAVAAGVVPLALGSQTAGSLTRPASFCGVAGYVAPVGAWPTRGITGLSPSLDAPGIITATVPDLAAVVAAVDGTAAEIPERLRLLWWPGTELIEIAPAMAEAVERTAHALHATDLGPGVRTPELAETHSVVMAYEAARSLSEEGRHSDLLSTPLRELLERGRAIPEDEYRAAIDTARKARAHVLGLLEQADAILGPAAPGPAPHGLAATGNPMLSRPWQLLGLPVVTVPGHHDASGMPLGLQLIGHPDRVGRLLGAAQLVEETIR